MTRPFKIVLWIIGSLVVLVALAVFAYWKLGQEPPAGLDDTTAAQPRHAPVRADTDRTEDAKALLRDIAAAQDRFLADSGRYTDNIRDLSAARHDSTADSVVVFTMPRGFQDQMLTATGEGWTATISSARHRCGIVVGKIPNPVEPTAAERDPICVSR